MPRQPYLSLAGLFLFLFLLAGLATAQNTVGTAFTYQGKVYDGGQPANGVYDLRFRLWDAASAGTQIGPNVNADDLSIGNGLINRTLNFGADRFVGQARWLEIGIRPGASAGAYTYLSPRQLLTPTPYSLYANNADRLDAHDTSYFATANHTHNASAISSAPLNLTGTMPGAAVISGTNLSTATLSVGVQGDGKVYGVIGMTSTTLGIGVLGQHLANNGTAPGVMGESASQDASAAAVLGVVTPSSPGGFSAGVRGTNNGTGGLGIGVFGSQAGSGWGVYGVAPSGIGVHGNSTNGFGIYGLSTNGMAIYGLSTNGTPGNFQITNNANASPALQASTSGSGLAVLATRAGGSGISLGQTEAIRGDNTDGPGVAGTANTAVGVYGTSTASSGMWGVAVTATNAGVLGRNDVTGGYGVWGQSFGGGTGVYGSSNTGIAGKFEITNAANTDSGLEVNTAGTGAAAKMTITNAASGARVIDVSNLGVGPGVFASSKGNAIWGITSQISSAGVIGDNDTGEAVVGRSKGGNVVGAVVGRCDGAGYGVRGFNTKEGYGVIGQAGISGGTGVGGRFENVNSASAANGLEAATNGSGFAASFTASGANAQGLKVSTTAGQGRNAVQVTNGKAALSVTNGYASGALVDDAIIQINVAGAYVLGTTNVSNGTTVWVVNPTGVNLTITNTTVGAYTVFAGRAQQFLFVSSADGTNWFPVQ